MGEGRMGEGRMREHDGRWHLTNVEEEIGGGQERKHHPRQRQRRSKSPAQLGVGWGMGWKRGEERPERFDMGVVYLAWQRRLSRIDHKMVAAKQVKKMAAKMKLMSKTFKSARKPARAENNCWGR